MVQAADFSQTGLTPIPVDSTPLPAVREASPFTGLGEVVSDVKDIFSSLTAGKSAKIVGQFTQDQLRIANAVDQGSISSAEAKTRMRAIYSRYLADNPTLIGEFTEAHRNVVNTSGLGAIVESGTLEEQRRLKAHEDALAAGFAAYNATPEELDEAALNHVRFLQSKRQAEELTQLLDLRSKKANVTTSEINAQNAINKAESENAAGRIVSFYAPKFFNEINTIVNQFSGSAKSPEERIQALAELNSRLSMIENTVAALSGPSGGDYANNLVSPKRRSYERAVDFINGKVQLEIYKSSVETGKFMVARNLQGDPIMALAGGLNVLVRSTNLTQLPGLNTSLAKTMLNMSGTGKTSDLKTLGKTTNLFVGEADSKDDRDNVQNYFKFVENGIKNVNGNMIPSGETKEEYVEAINTNLINIARSIDAYKDSVENPNEYVNLINFLAKPSTGTFLVNQGGIPSDIAQTARQAVSERYENVVAPLIRERFETGTLRVIGTTTGREGRGLGIPEPAESKPAKEYVEPMFEGDGVVYKQKAGVRGRVQPAQLRDLNNSLQPLNTLIRMYSHLKGSKDYNKSWEELRPLIFGEEEQDGGAE